MDEKSVKKIVSDVLKSMSSSWKANISSKKFFAYVIANVMLLVAGFAKLISTSDFASIFKIISVGYWSAQGSIDAIKAIGEAAGNRKTGTQDTNE